jgi:hypothetical protein
MRKAASQLREHLLRLSSVEILCGFDDEVTQVAVEAHRPAIQKPFVAEQSEGQSLLENDVDFCLPAQVMKGRQEEVDGGRNRRPFVAHQPDLRGRIAAQRGKLQSQEVPNATGEDRTGSASIDEGLRRRGEVSQTESDIDGGSKDPRA